MKTTNTLLLWSLVLFSFASCKKPKKESIAKLIFDEYKLPVMASNGQNYFGFLVDSQPVWRQKKLPFEGGPSVIYMEAEHVFELSMDDNQHGVYINVPTIINVGETYILKKSDYVKTAYASYYYTVPPVNGSNISQGYIFNTFDANPGYIKILRLDKQKRIVTGVFELDVERGGDIKSITKGRFDITYKTYRPIIM